MAHHGALRRHGGFTLRRGHLARSGRDRSHQYHTIESKSPSRTAPPNAMTATHHGVQIIAPTVSQRARLGADVMPHG